MVYLDAKNKPVKMGLYIHSKDPLSPIVIIKAEEDYDIFCRGGKTQEYFLIEDHLKFVEVFRKTVENLKERLGHLARSPAEEDIKNITERAGKNHKTLLDYLEKNSNKI